MKHPTFLIVCLLITAAGCAVPLATVVENYQNAPVCCASVNEFHFERISPEEKTSFDLNENSPAYQFDSGKSYFKAFILPSAAGPYTITVQSYMFGESIDVAYIFAPQIVTLNEAFEPVRRTDPAIFRLKKAGFAETAKQTWGLMYKLEGQVSFSEENRDEKYLIIFTTSELLKARTSLSTMRTIPIILPGMVSAIPAGEREVLVPHSPAGRISLSIRREQEPTP
jgi:maltose operon protein